MLFVLGFAVVFVLLGSLTGAAGAWLFVHTRQLNVVLGIITILLGIAFLGAFGFLQRDWRIHRVPAVGLAAAPLIGFLFGVGWTPCVGPTLAAINVLSVNEATASRGAVLSGVFALGLGLPFIAAALAYRRMMRAFAVVRRHQRPRHAPRRRDDDRRRAPARHRLVGAARAVAPAATSSGFWVPV